MTDATGTPRPSGFLIDPNVILDVAIEDPDWFEWSATALSTARVADFDGAQTRVAFRQDLGSSPAAFRDSFGPVGGTDKRAGASI